MAFVINVMDTCTSLTLNANNMIRNGASYMKVQLGHYVFLSS
jgi:hypothetical protein